MNSQTLLKDPITKEEVDYIELKTLRGKETADIVLLAHQENRHRNFEETKRCQVIHNKRKNKSLYQSQPYIKSEKEISPIKDDMFESEKKKIRSNKKRPPYIPIHPETIENNYLMTMMLKPMTLYLCLRHLVVRNRFKGDTENLYERYYKKGIIPASIKTQTDLGKMIGVDRHTISRYLELLEKYCIISIDKINITYKGDTKEYCVYLLGKVVAGNEVFCIDEMAELL